MAIASSDQLSDLDFIKNLKPAAPQSDADFIKSLKPKANLNNELLGSIYGDPALATAVGYATDVSQSPDTSTMDAIKGAAAGLGGAIPVAGRAIRRNYPAPVDVAPAPDDPLYTTSFARIGSGLIRTVPEAIGGALAGPAGVGGVLVAGAADEAAYNEQLRRAQTGAPGNYLEDMAVGIGVQPRDENDTPMQQLARTAGLPVAGAFGAGGAAIGRSAGVAANIGYNLIANPAETALQAYGQGADPLDPAMLGTSALIGGLAEGAGRIRPKAKPVTDLAPLPRPQQMGPMEVIAEPLPLPPGNVPRGLPDLNVDRPGLSGMPDGMVTLEVGPDGTTYVRDTPPSILPGGNFTEADVARAQQMQELALIKERSARGLPPPFLEQRGLPPADAGLGVRYADDETLNTVQMAREAGLPPVQRYTSGGRPLDGGQAPPDYPDVGVGVENPLPPLSRPGVIPRQAMRGEPIPAPRELPPPVERVPEAMPEPIRNNPQPIAEESAPLPPPPPMAGAEPAPLPDAPVRGKKAVPVAKVPKAKEPWEMTRDEFDASPWLPERPKKQTPTQKAMYQNEAFRIHRSQVQRAFEAGKPVPAEVLADYPDLVKKGGDPPAQQGQKGQEEGLLKPAQVEPTPQAEAPLSPEIAAKPDGELTPEQYNQKHKWARDIYSVYKMDWGSLDGYIENIKKRGGTVEERTLGDMDPVSGRENAVQGFSNPIVVRFEMPTPNGNKKFSVTWQPERDAKNPRTQGRFMRKPVEMAGSAEYPSGGLPPETHDVAIRRAAERGEPISAENRIKYADEVRMGTPMSAEAEAPTYTARNLMKGRATEIARESRGSVVPDPDNPKKWAVVPGKQKPQPPKPTGGEPSPLPKPKSTPRSPEALGIVPNPKAAAQAAADKTRKNLLNSWVGKFFYRPEGKITRGGASLEEAAKKTPIGEQAAQKILAVETDTNRMESAAIADLEDAQTKLSRQDKAWMRDNFKSTYEAGKPMPNPRIKAYADAWTKSHTNMANEATRLGVNVFDPKTGKMRPFQRIQNYFPHVLTDEARDALRNQSGEVYDAIVAAAKLNGTSMEALLNLANPSDVRTRTNKNLEISRVADLPETVEVNGKTIKVLETDPFSALPRNVGRAARRLAFIKHWGQEGIKEQTETLARGIQSESGSAGVKAFEDAILSVQGIEQGSAPPKSWSVYTSIARPAQLSLASVQNLTGIVPILAKYGFKRSIKSIGADIADTYHRNLARFTGENKSKFATEFEEMRRGGGWSPDVFDHSFITADLQGKSARISREAMKWTGFNWINKHLNRVASRAAKTMTIDALNYLRDPNDAAFKKAWEGRSPASVRQVLRTEFGFSDADLDRMVKSGATQRDLDQTVQRASAKTNVNSESSLDRPRWMNAGIYRELMAYMSYSRAMGNATMDAIYRSRQGDWKPLATLLIGGTAANMGAEELRDYMVGRERKDDTFLDSLARGIMAAGVLGYGGSVASDVKYGVERGSPFSGVIGVPALSFADNIAAGLYDIATKKKHQGAGPAAKRMGQAIAKSTGIMRAANNMLGDTLEMQKKTGGLPRPKPAPGAPTRPRRPRWDD